MGRLAEVWRRLRALRHREPVERGLQEEIRFHIECETEKNLERGMPPDEAHRQARLRFGGVAPVLENVRDEFRMAGAEDLIRDLRHSGRALRRAPGFTVVVILTLALGIGATTAMFSVVNGVLLEPLPYPEQDRLVEIVHEAPGIGVDQLFASPAIYFAYGEESRAFDGVGLWDWDQSPATVTGRGDPEAVPSLQVTHEVLPLLGAVPVIGRTFGPADDAPGSPPTAIISYGYWQRRFGGADPLHRTLVVNGVPREIIGVLPRWFRFFAYSADLFYPLQPVRSEAAFPSFDGRAIARVKEGLTLADADADAARVIRILGREYPGSRTFLERAALRPGLRWLKETVVGDLRRTLWLLMGTIGLLLLIACANVANLVLVRTHGRRPELAIRGALGAGWAALLRVLLTESVLLGLAGGLAGLIAGYASLPLLRSLGAAYLPEIMAVTIDPRVLLVVLGLSLAAIFAFALIPVLQQALPRDRVANPLQGAARGTTEGRSSSRTRQLLVSAQIALSLVLLAGSGLMVRSFRSLHRVDPGFRDPDQVQTFQITIPAVEMPAPSAADDGVDFRIQTQRAVADRLAAVAGVESVGLAAFNDGLPLDGDGRSTGIYVEGRPAREPAAVLKEIRAVSPGFFETLRTPLLAGRAFDWSDVDRRRRVAIVSGDMARAEWGSAAAALGRRIARDPEGPWFEVVGVVAPIHDNGPGEPAPATVTFPLLPSFTASFVVRSGRVGSPGFLEELRRAVWSVNRRLSPAGAQTLGVMYRRSMARTTMALRLLAITGAMALALSLIGVYGSVSYAVSQRRREIGIRLALGAAQGAVRRLFVRRALTVVGFGIAAGLAAAAALTRLMRSLLFGVGSLDPPTYVATVVTLVVAAALASYLSAWRASGTDPVEVLKGE